jgi:hypothetical protein
MTVRLYALLLVTASAVVIALGAVAPSAHALEFTYGDTCVADLKAAGTYNSSYACNTRVSGTLSYKGWANMLQNQCGKRLMIAAWRWNATTRSWSKTYIAGRTRVYAWPFAQGWTWVWTSRTGWLATKDWRVIVNQWFNPLIMCSISSELEYVD